MERKWIGQLVIDFVHISRYRRLGLEVPNFAISVGKKRLGTWDSSLRTISISDHLIQNYSWDVVVEILKHEMAHQYVTDVSGFNDAMAHGEEFQQACLIIGVHPDFRGAKGRKPKFLRPIGEEKLSPIMRKVEKLLALSGSPNENEAARAMEKANSLIAEYNISIVENNSELVDYDYIQIVAGKKRVPIWKKSILSIVSKHFFVRFIMISGYCAKNSEDLKIAELIGSHQNLAIAEHVFYFLEKQVVTLWGTYQKENNAPGKHKNAFMLGVLAGFDEKMKTADKTIQEKVYGCQQEKLTSALVVAADPALNQFFNERYPRTTKSRRSGLSLDAGSYESGRQEGKRLTIHKTVNQADGNKGILLAA